MLNKHFGKVIATVLIALLSAIGGLAGLALGAGGTQLLHLILPALPVHTPVLYVIIAGALAISIGIAQRVSYRQITQPAWLQSRPCVQNMQGTR